MGSSSTVYAVYIFVLMMFLRSETDAKLREDIMNHNAELLKNIKSYEIIKPYRLEGRTKRHASTKMSSAHLQDTTLVFPGRKKQFHLDISLNMGLFSPQFEEHYVSNDSPELAQQISHEHCFYHGTVRGEENSDVSLSTCDGIEGVIRTDDETYFIHPLKSQDGQVLDDHIMFNADDVSEQPATCGHDSHKISQGKRMSHGHSTNFKRRVRRNILTETKYVELFIINDRRQYELNREKTGLRAKQLVNHLDSVFWEGDLLYQAADAMDGITVAVISHEKNSFAAFLYLIFRLRKIRIALVKVETWMDRNLITVDKNASKALSNFLKYKKQNLDKDNGKHFDNVQLITGEDFDGTTVGYAPIQSICGTRSAAVVQDYSKQAAVTASTMAHELGHNFGMIHDKSNCECPDIDGQCIMSSFLSKAATRFSTCSLSDLRNTLEKGYGQCLFDEPKQLYGDAICRNGFVEEGEQCDCGTQEECDHFGNKCCNATSCMFLPGAVCSHGECCENCQLKSRGKECREKYDDCDLPEYCTGDNEMCPEDHHVYNGLPCKDNDGYCYGGICRNIELQCQNLFGNDIKAGNEQCFSRNIKGSAFYHCKNDTHGQFACPKEDVLCGRIHCLSNRADHKLIRGQQRATFWATVDRKSFCIAPSVTFGDGLDPQYVSDGTKCAEGKMCMNSRCVPVSVAIPISAYIKCPFNCSGNGICNSNGNCHCNSGFACPDCQVFGPDHGGSEDSGQGCQTTSVKDDTGEGVNVAAAVLIPIFLLLLIGVVVLVFIKRRTIQDRLSHYKFVRRSTTRSSKAPPAGKSQPSGLHPGLISNPTPAAQPVVQSRRAPPARHTVPLMENEQSEPTSTPQQVPRAPQRPPNAPVQPRTGHQSVPLFPPSATSVPQETVKPRPPPPTRPLAKSNLPRTPSAPPTSPNNRPKLPPSRPPPSYTSVPDIPSAEEPKTTPSVAKRPNAVPPRPKPRASPSSHQSVPEFPDEIPVPKPRNIAPRPGHQSVPLFNLPDNPEDGGSVKPSAVKANQARPSPPRKPKANEEGTRVDFRAGLKPVAKPWEKL